MFRGERPVLSNTYTVYVETALWKTLPLLYFYVRVTDYYLAKGHGLTEA